MGTVECGKGGNLLAGLGQGQCLLLLLGNVLSLLAIVYIMNRA